MSQGLSVWRRCCRDHQYLDQGAAQSTAPPGSRCGRAFGPSSHAPGVRRCPR